METVAAAIVRLALRHLHVVTALYADAVAGPVVHGAIEHTYALAVVQVNGGEGKIPPVSAIIDRSLDHQIANLNIVFLMRPDGWKKVYCPGLAFDFKLSVKGDVQMHLQIVDFFDDAVGAPPAAHFLVDQANFVS